MTSVKVEMNELLVKNLDSAGAILGHKSRSETIRWLALKAVEIAQEEARPSGYGIIEEGHKRQFNEGKQ